MKFLVPILGLHIVLAVYLGVTLNIWSDESCSLATTNGSFLDAMLGAVNFEFQPPGYFVALWLWRQVHPSLVWARSLSVICTTISIVVFYQIVRRVAVSRAMWPIWASAAFAFHPYTIFAATEIRLYAMGLLLTVVQLDWYWKGFVEEKNKWRWAYLAIAVVSLYVNVLLALSLAAHQIALWATDRRKLALQHLAIVVLAAAIYLPMFVVQLRSLKVKDLSVDSSLAKSFSFVIGSVAYNLAPLPRLDETLNVRTGLTFILVVVAGAIILRNWRAISERHRIAWVYLIAVMSLLGLFLLTAHLRLNPRYTYPLIAASLLAWGLVIEFIRARSFIEAVWLGTLLFCAGTLWSTYHPLCKTGDWIRLTHYLETHEADNEPIVVFISEVDTILKNYYHGRNIVVPVPGPQRLDRFVYADFDIKNPEIPQSVLESKLQAIDAFWLVTNEAAIQDGPHEYHQQYLHEYLHQNFEVVQCQNFVDSKVCRLQRK